MKVILNTSRMYLRQFEPGDAQLLLELDSDPEVRRYLDQPQAPSIEQCTEIVNRFMAYYESGDTYGYWAAHVKDAPSAFLGWFHLRSSRVAPFEPELGYRLNREFWGQGYATEGSRALLDRARREQTTQRVIAVTMEENLASRRVMEKVGMSYEASFLHDNRLPCVRYALEFASEELGS